LSILRLLGENTLKIQYFNKHSGELEIEKVYGAGAVEWLYQSKVGRSLSDYLVRAPISQFYGDLQSSSWSKRKVKPFIKKFNIKMDDFLPEEGMTCEDPYSSFNHFFIRRFKEGKRDFVSDSHVMPAFSEARYFGYGAIDDSVTVPVKGHFLKAQDLVASSKWGKAFSGGPLMIARLCPVDYHRFHFPDDGHILDAYPVPGQYHSVNPIAIKEKPDIFMTNERFVTILETKNFGKLAYIEVGAICVGKIVQSRAVTGTFKRGEEKGYFLFGGSTVVVVGEKGKWSPDQLMLDKTREGIEVYQHLGSPLASS
jgi:phosphatidylserine decarboxylase